MKIILLSFIYDKNILTESALLDQHFTSRDWAEALVAKDIEVTVIKRFSKNSELKDKGVKYIFRKDRLKDSLRFYSIPFNFIRYLRKQDADVIHVSGFVFPFQVFLLRLFLS